MPIDTSVPTIVPAQPEKTYDKWWVELHISGLDKARAVVLLRKYRIDENGANEYAPNEPTVTFVVDDVMADAATRAGEGKPLLAQTASAILAAVVELGTERGLI